MLVEHNGVEQVIPVRAVHANDDLLDVSVQVRGILHLLAEVVDGDRPQRGRLVVVHDVDIDHVDGLVEADRSVLELLQHLVIHSLLARQDQVEEEGRVLESLRLRFDPPVPIQHPQDPIARVELMVLAGQVPVHLLVRGVEVVDVRLVHASARQLHLGAGAEAMHIEVFLFEEGVRLHAPVLVAGAHHGYLHVFLLHQTYSYAYV